MSAIFSFGKECFLMSVDFSFLKVGNTDFPSLPNLATEKLSEGTIINDDFGYTSLAEMGVYRQEGTAEF